MRKYFLETPDNPFIFLELASVHLHWYSPCASPFGFKTSTHEVNAMNCPTCGRPAWDQAPQCTYCGQDLGLFHEVNRIKMDLSVASRNSNGVTQRLRELEGKIGSLESTLITRLNVKTEKPRAVEPARVTSVLESTPKSVTPKPLPRPPPRNAERGSKSKKSLPSMRGGI